MTDFALAAQIKPPEMDPLATVGKLQAVQQGQLQNRLLGLNLGGKQALGDIIGQSTDPNTGETDWNAVSAAASQRPDAAILLPEIQKQVLDRKISEQQLAGVTLDTQMKRSGLIANTVGSLLATPEGQLTPEVVQSALTDRLVKSGIFSDKPSLTQLASVYQQVSGLDETHLRQLLQQYGQAADMTTSRIETQYAQAHGGMTPSAANAQTTLNVPKPGGGFTPTTMRAEDAVKLESGGGVQTGPAENAEGLTPVQAGAQAYGVTTPGGTPGIVTQGAAAHAAATGGTPQVQITGAAPGVAAANAAPVAERGQRATEIENSYAGSVQRAAMLDELGAAGGDFRSGPGAQRWSKYVSEFNRVTGAHFSDDAASAQQVFGKIAEQVAAQQAATMHLTNTNAQHEAAQLASPNATYSPEANNQVRALLRGNEDYIQTRAKAWAAAQRPGPNGQPGATPAQLDEFERQFAQIYDPRFFQEAYMTPNQRGAMARQMGPKAFQAFEAKRKQALSLKWDNGQ